MRKKISIFFIGGPGSTAKQINTSVGTLFFLGFFFLACVASAGVVVYDYIRIRQTLPESLERECRTVARQRVEIENQRKQVEKLTGDIDEIKNRLVELNQFEEKIRVIANIEKQVNEELFGVGGSIPEDLDAGSEIREKHNSLLREMHNQVELLDQAAQIQHRGFDSLVDLLQNQRNLLASTPAIWPVKGWVTSTFGHRKSPFTGLREFHKGLDIATRKGSPIIAPADGVVSATGTKGYLGKMITVDHGHGIVTRYGHIQKALKKKGDKVKRGDVIALVGATGRVTGPHVHYEVRLNGMPVNPKKYILN